MSLLYYEYDHDVALDVRYEEGQEDKAEEILKLIEQGLSIDEIKQFLKQKSPK
jgi:DNA-binding transcriptional MerR regulator